MVTSNNSKRVIQNAVEGKRRQARNLSIPVLVAVDAKGILSRLEDFDTALFGHSVHMLHPSGVISAPTFRADGLFMKGEGQPMISGVLAFTEVGFLRCSQPILYLHSRFKGYLPDALMQLECRALSISVREPQRRSILEGLGFVDPDS